MIEIDEAPPLSARFEVDINSADWPEMAQLPDVGETLARRIVESRAVDGPFADLGDLRRVRGIGPKTLERIRPHLRQLPEPWDGGGTVVGLACWFRTEHLTRLAIDRGVDILERGRGFTMQSDSHHSRLKKSAKPSCAKHPLLMSPVDENPNCLVARCVFCFADFGRAAARLCAAVRQQDLPSWEGTRTSSGSKKGRSSRSLTEKIAHNEFLCTEKSFENFELRLKFKVLGQGANAGVQFRTKRIPDHFESAATRPTWGTAGGARCMTNPAARRLWPNPTPTHSARS